ncbi:LytR/AlgR family response regulator transcription factor [Lactobacillus psittaci]|uniref:Response regulator n=1 Tax=Lactobacillus psittaci DSM 15354 TaxID=1122152 RepID=A0A0R1RXM1_9LACO|nr:LytTR family DNA-binding domain-containing protein [Lactobacillus psittaci]KRL61757.1 response regulator [Lactobacillus psittaci DSM 15354]
MIPILLCDDNEDFLNYYASIIEDTIAKNKLNMKLAFKTVNPWQLLEYVENNALPALYILDIDLNQELDGIDLAEKIKTLQPNSKIAFLTSYEDYALETLQRQIAPLSYIVKGSPNSKQLMAQLLTKLNNTKLEKSEAYLSFEDKSINYKISLSRIYYLTTSSNKPHMIKLICKNNVFEFYGNLRELAEKFPQLLRIHHSYLINPKNVVKVDFKQRLVFFPAGAPCTYPATKGKELRKLFTQKAH